MVPAAVAISSREISSSPSLPMSVATAPSSGAHSPDHAIVVSMVTRPAIGSRRPEMSTVPTFESLRSTPSA